MTYQGTFWWNAFSPVGILLVSEPKVSPVAGSMAGYGQLAPGFFSRGDRSRPCMVQGSLMPANWNIVGTRSTPATGAVHTFPFGMRPGMEKMSGDRMLASYGATLTP